MAKVLFYPILSIFIGSCVGSKVSVNTPESNENYKEVVADKLGEEEVLCLTNKSNSYVLCIKQTKSTTLQPANRILYLVVKIDDNSIVLEGKIKEGTISWVSNNEIEVFRTPGIIRKDQSHADFITLYNVETGKSYPKKHKETH